MTDKKDKYLDLARKLKKKKKPKQTVKHLSDGDPDCNWTTWK